LFVIYHSKIEELEKDLKQQTETKESLATKVIMKGLAISLTQKVNNNFYFFSVLFSIVNNNLVNPRALSTYLLYYYLYENLPLEKQ
jgi:hypothetical protein